MLHTAKWNKKITIGYASLYIYIQYYLVFSKKEISKLFLINKETKMACWSCYFLCLSKRVFINPFYKLLVSLANISTSPTSLLDFQNNTCRQSTTGPYSSGNPVCWYIRQCISSASVCKLVCEEPLFSFFRVCTRLGTKTTIWKKKPQTKQKTSNCLTFSD